MHGDAYYKSPKTVYIIESPSAADLLQGRCEGAALSNALTLGDIENKHYLVANEEALDSCLKLIGEREGRRFAAREPVCMFLHFSFHANDQEMGFTSGGLAWKDFWQKIIDACKSMNYYMADDKICAAIVMLSACHGHAGLLAAKGLSESPFSGGIAPVDAVLWDDSLTFFSVYYHLSIKKCRPPKIACPAACAAAGLPEGAFKLVTARTLGFDITND